jgi:Tol biopolymer transport system component
MKRCPQCSRVESDNALVFCRVDGARLVDQPQSHDDDATFRFDDQGLTKPAAGAGLTPADYPARYHSVAPTQILSPSGRVETRGLTSRGRKGFAIAAVIVVALIGFGVVAIIAISKYLPRRKATVPFQSRTITRLTSISRVGTATVSPDGKYVAYSALDASGQSSLWLRQVATSSNVQIVPPAGLEVNFGQTTFSPDGNYLYYLRGERGGRGVLYQVPVLGGTSKKILDDATRISFSPDGKQFAFERRDPTKGEDMIVIANADGTNERKLATRKHPDYFLPGVAWSPDGQTIACPIGGFEGGYYRSFGLVRVSNGTQTRLTSHGWNNVERAVWLSDGSGLIATAADRHGDQLQIWYISYPDGQAQPLTSDLSDYHNVSLTSDSNSLVAVLSDRTSNIWVMPYGDWGGGRQITSSKSNGDLGLGFSSDGRIVYDSRASGSSDLWISDADGRKQKQLTDDKTGKRNPSITPDGKYLLYDTYASGLLQVWKLDLATGKATIVTSSVGFDASPSPDGQWVFYTNFGPGGFNIWKVSINGGAGVRVINKYALIPSVSPDGKLIACYFVDETTRATKIAIFSAEGGEPLKLLDLPQTAPSGSPPVRWTADGRAVTYIATRAGVSNIWLQPIDGTPPRQLTDYKDGRIFWFDWSRDGKWLAASRGVVTTDVILISNAKQ